MSPKRVAGERESVKKSGRGSRVDFADLGAPVRAGGGVTARSDVHGGPWPRQGISVDYRMRPEAYFPTALDDSMTLYKALSKTTKPKNIAILGSSAGGALNLEMILKSKIVRTGTI